LEWSGHLNKLIHRSQGKVDALEGWQPQSSSREKSMPELINYDTSEKTEALKQLRLVFADGSWPYDGNTPENYPLGGPHSALVYLTRELAALGHDVHVYNNCDSSGLFHGVHYHKFKEIVNANNFLYADAFIALRNPTFFSSWLNAEVRILWAQDTFDQPHLQILESQEDIRQNIDYIFCVSRWQAWTFLNHLHWPTEKMFVTRNAVWPEYFQKEFSEPQGQRLVYTSTRLRGLELLLRLFPKISQSVPNAELHVFSSMQLYRQSKEEDEKEYGHIYRLAEQPGVVPTLHWSI